MSKTTLKKFLSELNREQLAEVIIQVYESRKEAREFLDYFANPDEKAALDKYRAVIMKEFQPLKGRAKRRVSVCRKAIKDFSTLQPSVSATTDLALTYVEQLIIHLVRNPAQVTESHKREMVAKLQQTIEFITVECLGGEFGIRIESIAATIPHAGKEIENEISEFFCTGTPSANIVPLATRKPTSLRKFISRRHRQQF